MNIDEDFLEKQEKEAEKQLKFYNVKTVVLELSSLDFPKKSVYGFANKLLKKSDVDEILKAIEKSRSYIFNLPYQKKYSYILSLLEEEMI